jgi:hypothetical protein
VKTIIAAPEALGLLAVAQLVDLFLRWAPRHGEGGFYRVGISGLNVPEGSWVLAAAIALLVWQLARYLSVPLTGRSDAVVSAMLALVTGLLGGAAVLNLSVSSNFSVGTNLAYGAILQIVISLAFVGAGVLALRQ